MKLVLTLVAAFALSSAEALARPSNPIARSAVRSLARHQIAMADVLTRPPSIQLAPTKPSSDLQSGKAKKFKLLLFNDSVNKREFVAKVLTGTIPEMTEATAYTVMQKAHTAGFAVVGVWMFELAEAYCDGLTSQGLTAAVTAESDD